MSLFFTIGFLILSYPLQSKTWDIPSPNGKITSSTNFDLLLGVKPSY